MGVISLHNGDIYGPVYGPDYPATEERKKSEHARYKESLKKRYKGISRIELIHDIEYLERTADHYRSKCKIYEDNIVAEIMMENAHVARSE